MKKGDDASNILNERICDFGFLFFYIPFETERGFVVLYVTVHC